MKLRSNAIQVSFRPPGHPRRVLEEESLAGLHSAWSAALAGVILTADENAFLTLASLAAVTASLTPPPNSFAAVLIADAPSIAARPNAVSVADTRPLQCDWADRLWIQCRGSKQGLSQTEDAAVELASEEA